MVCYGCRQEIPAGQETVYRQNGTDYQLCGQCAQILQAEAAQPVGSAPPVNYVGGLLAGIVVAAVVLGLWYGMVVLTERMWAYAALLAGAAIGGAVRIASGNRGGVGLQVISGVLTLATMALSEYFIVRHFLLADMGITKAPLFASTGLMVRMVVEGLRATPLTLLFWIIALGLALVTSGKGGEKRRSLLSS